MDNCRILTRDRQDSQNLNNDSFQRPPVTSAECIIGTEEYPDAGISIIYDADDYAQEYGLIKEAFRASTKHDIFQPYISDHYFRSSKIIAADVGCNLYVFDIRYQQKFEAS